MLVSAVRDRIEQEIEVLEKRVQGAVDLAQLIARGGLPNVTPWCFVLPLGTRSRSEGDASSGVFAQMVDETVAVLLVVGAQGDVTGAKAIPTLDELIDAITQAIAGWSPEGAIGDFRFARGALLSINNGLVMYQLDFALQDQLRILS